MNKKFSTLLAGAALLGAVTANGAVKLNQGANNGLYQLKAGSAFLSITENSTTHEDEIKMVSHSSANLGGTMWCVTVDAENQGQNPKYDFTNKIGKFLGLEISTIKGKAAAPLAAVPAVVGTAMIGTQGFFVGAVPSRLLTSSNSGFAMMIPIAFAVSMEEPPPIAMI